MKKIAEMISYMALVLLVTAPVLFYTEQITLQTNKRLMLVATIIWFVTAIYWMGQKEKSAE